MHQVTMVISEQLNFDVLGVLYEFLYENGVVTKGCLRFAFCRFKCCRKIFR